MKFQDESDFENESPDIQSDVTRDVVKKFRDQIHALGALWIFFGVVACAIAAVAFSGNNFLANNVGGAQLMLVIVGTMGALWFILGIMTCLKQIWAVYVGL